MTNDSVSSSPFNKLVNATQNHSHSPVSPASGSPGARSSYPSPGLIPNPYLPPTMPQSHNGHNSQPPPAAHPHHYGHSAHQAPQAHSHGHGHGSYPHHQPYHHNGAHPSAHHHGPGPSPGPVNHHSHLPQQPVHQNFYPYGPPAQPYQYGQF